MRCCVHFCKNTLDLVSTSEGNRISFYGFPSEVHLRAAWLRALGKQDSHLPDSAVVCSQHFLNDDIYETECGLRQIVTGAIPSTVQVCMICLDTDSKLILMSKYKLDKTYEKLTGHPMYDQGNLKQTLCVQCAQRLINFSRFRDKSLRARALMMDLVEKHELITRRHIKMINSTKHQLKSSMVLKTLGPDHCDLHILEHPSEDTQTELEEIEQKDVVKTEESDDSMSVDVDVEEIHEEDSNVNDFVQDPLKYESAPFQCTLCLEEFVHVHAYMQHIMSVHLQNGAGDGECDTSQVCKPHTAVSSSSSHSALVTENKQADPSPCAQAAQTTVVPPSASLVTINEINSTEEVDTNVSSRYKTITDCFVKLNDIFAKKVFQRQDVSLMKTQRDAMSCDSLNTVSEDFSHQATSQSEVPTTEYIEPVTNSTSTVKEVVLKTLQSNSSNNFINVQCINSSLNTAFMCDICGKKFTEVSVLVKHIETHIQVRRVSCKICSYKCNYQSQLTHHVRTHTGEKPYACELCKYKCAQKNNLVNHMRTHTGEKSYSCNICAYKCSLKRSLKCHMLIHTGGQPLICKICNEKFAINSELRRHMKNHTGENSYACAICEYKCSAERVLINHLRTHTVEKPFTCKICNSNFVQNNDLDKHMRTHTVEKPFPCTFCNFKSAYKGGLVRHMNIHTGVKPFACDLCEFKCIQKSNLAYHMRTHTGEKPYSCAICEYKGSTKRCLNIHMMSHTGEKPYACDLCEYKSAQKGNLDYHMTTHTGVKPYSCAKCEYKCALKGDIPKHMRTHTGYKPFSCTLCDYKCAAESNLVCHMRTHTGVKPYACELCKRKFAKKSNLVYHMRTHTRDKPYHCQICEYSCSIRSTLNNHNMICHTGE